MNCLITRKRWQKPTVFMRKIQRNLQSVSFEVCSAGNRRNYHRSSLSGDGDSDSGNSGDSNSSDSSSNSDSSDNDSSDSDSSDSSDNDSSTGTNAEDGDTNN